VDSVVRIGSKDSCLRHQDLISALEREPGKSEWRASSRGSTLGLIMWWEKGGHQEGSVAKRGPKSSAACIQMHIMI
jgi:hypothetical protein